MDSAPPAILRLEISRRQFGAVMVVFFLAAHPHELGSESITITTTYPSPAGIYNQIITTGDAGGKQRNTILNRNAGNTILVPPSNGGGRVGIGTTNPSSSALLELKTVSKGFLPPRMSQADRDSIVAPSEGLTIYNMDTKNLETPIPHISDMI